MSVIPIIITIIIIILIFLGIFWLIHNKSKPSESIKIIGGEGPKIESYSDDEVKLLSFTEQVLFDTLSIESDDSIVYNYVDIQSLTGQTWRKFKDFISIKVGNKFYMIHKNLEPKLFSDSLLDGINLCIHVPEIKYVIAMNEFPSIKLIYPSLSNYSDILRKTKFKETCEYMNNSLSQPKLLKKNDLDKLDMLKLVLNNKIEPSFDLSDIKSGNNIMCYIENGNSIKQIKITNSLKYGIRNEVNKQIFVFLEFSYENFSESKKHLVQKLFLQIHKITKSLLKRIIEDINHTHIYVFRFVLHDDKFSDVETIKFNNFWFDGRKIIYYVEDFDNPGKSMIKYPINIPDTKISFDMDEYLFIETSNFNYHIQIEHSENSSRHKSNLVEFLLRTFNYFGYPNESLKELLKNINYNLDNLNKDISIFSPFRISNPNYFN